MDYESELISKENIADGTMAFHFRKSEGFSFEAGQSIDLTLLNPPETDAEGNTRAFSIAAAPHEDELMIASRMRDTAFKRVLKSADIGLKVQITGPFGSFILHENSSRPAIMLVGGIGVTPFRSIIKEATQKKLPHKIYLFYSNRQPKDAPFLEELKNLEKINPNFKFIPTMTDVENIDSWDGEKGYIDEKMVDKYVPDRAGAIYYSAGPQKMVFAMRTMLNTAGISNDDIRTEEFSGYH